MTATGTPTEVSRYLDQVRALLVDLPAEEREELLDDLAAHLHEVRAESDEPLEQALGTPAAFAAELLASSAMPLPALAPTCGPRSPNQPDAAGSAWRCTPPPAGCGSCGRSSCPGGGSCGVTWA